MSAGRYGTVPDHNSFNGNPLQPYDRAVGLPAQGMGRAGWGLADLLFNLQHVHTHPPATCFFAEICLFLMELLTGVGQPVYVLLFLLRPWQDKGNIKRADFATLN